MPARRVPSFPLPCETATPYDVRSARLAMLALVRKSDMDPLRKTRAVTPDAKPIDIAHAYRDPRVLYAVAWSFLHDVTAYDREEALRKKSSPEEQKMETQTADSKREGNNRSKSLCQYKGRSGTGFNNNSVRGNRCSFKPSTAVVTESRSNPGLSSKPGLTTTPIGSRQAGRGLSDSAVRNSNNPPSTAPTRESFGMNNTDNIIQSLGRRYPYRISNSPYRTNVFPVRDSNRIPSNIAYRHMHEMHMLELEQREREQREEAQRSGLISDVEREPVVMHENNVSNRNYGLTSPSLNDNNGRHTHFSATVDGDMERRPPF